MAIPIKSPAEIDAMARAAKVAWRIVGEGLDAARAGVTTAEIDDLVTRRIADAGALPIFQGYRMGASPAFPASCCICLNEEVVHGIPGPRLLRDGDLLTVDVGLSIEGWCADAASSRVVGENADEAVLAMVGEVRAAVDDACAAMATGVRWSSIVEILETRAAAGGWRLVPSFPGHGIGRSLHEPPKAWTAPDGERAPRDFVLRPGMVLTLEPIAVLGEPEIVGLDDGWTVVTRDRAWACHEERMIAITRGGPRALTA